MMLVAACGSSAKPTSSGDSNTGSATNSSGASASAPSTATSSPSAGAGSSTPTGPAKDVTLMLNWYPYGEHAPIYYGLKSGIFTKHGINLKIEAGKGSGPVAQAVGQKQVDFGWVDTPNVLSSVAAGVPIKSVGVFYQSSCAAIQFYDSKNVKKPADLKGMKVAETPGDAFTTAFPAFLKANGMTINDVQIVNVTGAAKMSSVISGQADALLGFIDDQGPTIQDKTGKKMSYLRFADFGLPYEGTGLVANDATIKSDPALVTQMMQAISESFTAAEANSSAAVDSMSGASANLPNTAVLTEQWKRAQTCMSTANTKSNPPGADSQVDWEQTVKTFQDLGQLKSGSQVSDFWDSSFAPKS
jgi:NitT/TauT family transport system substrate-binding protein